MRLDINAMKHSARRATRLLKALSNENRLMILCHLHQGEKSVSQLEELVGLSQSALSQHLARLRRDGLVTARRDGQTVYYRPRGNEASRILEVLAQLYCPT